MSIQHKFIDRKEELNFLDEKYRSDKAELIVLYGRRRIGKTTLLKKFMEGKNATYFLGGVESSENTLKRLSKLTGSEINRIEKFLDWIEKKYLAEKGCLIIDEFPFLVENFPSFPSLLQEAWDERLAKTKAVLILCGSSISMMEKHALDYKSPLYGRRTGQWKVTKIQTSFLNKFFPGYSPEELVLTYATLDMIPGYLTKFDPKKRPWENIREQMLSKGGYFYEEVPILLREELRDPANYLSILSAIAAGANSFERIKAETGLDKSMISKYLHILEGIGMVVRKTPALLTYKGKLKSRNRRYGLGDNFVHFWLRYVYSNEQDLEIGRLKEVTVRIKEDIKYYLGEKFEELVKESLPWLGFNEYSEVGSWWHKSTEVDLVAVSRQKKKILLGECKWKDNVNAERVLKELKEKSESMPLPSDWKKEHVVFSRSFKKKTEEAKCLSLEEIRRKMWK